MCHRLLANTNLELGTAVKLSSAVAQHSTSDGDCLVAGRVCPGWLCCGIMRYDTRSLPGVFLPCRLLIGVLCMLMHFLSSIVHQQHKR